MRTRTLSACVWVCGGMLAILLVLFAVPALPPDLDYSDGVDGRDLIQFSRALNTSPNGPGWRPAADLDYSGLVDEEDLGILVRYFGLTGRVRRVWALDGATEALKRLTEDGALLGAFSGFATPKTVSVYSADGTIWVADYGNDQVARLDRDGNILARISGFDSPSAVAVNPLNGDCWVADTNKDRVALLSSDVADGYDVDSDTGSHTVLTGFSRPSALAVSASNGVCWVSDSNSDQVVRVAANGGAELGRFDGFDNPGALSVHPVDGTCWVVDGNRQQVVKLSVVGAELLRLSGFTSPQGLVVDPQTGGCVVTDQTRVVRLDASGAIVFSTSGFNPPLGPFLDPSTGN
ncbi:hypothetical protein HQ520_16630, partial [bacterium]|nr:hypothetical protein [bacterium]